MRNILLIEDDVVLRETTQELLELSNFDVISAADGKEGVYLATKNIPDIIICDIMMPLMDGYEVLQILSDNDATMHIPFIFLSAKTDHKDIRKGMDLGADDYLTKPFQEDELLSAIESRIAKATILKEKRIVPQVETSNKISNLDELKNFLLDHGKKITYKPGETIYMEGGHATQFYLMYRGVIKNHKMDEHGKELITSLSKEDDFFGYASLIDSIPHQESTTAMEDTEVYMIDKIELKRIFENNHDLTFELIQLLTSNLLGVKDQLLKMAYGSVRKKTANTIIQFSEKIKTHPLKNIRISRNDLASVAGIATESLIRTLSGFKKEGIINIEGRNIEILDAEKLRNIN